MEFGDIFIEYLINIFMETTDANSINPLPYVIIFAILFLVMLGVLTWTLGIWYKANQCAINPNIWCSDSWTCNNSCPSGIAASPCFNQVEPTGLASCLFGPNALGAKTCLNVTEEGGTSCACPTGIATARNCFSGCAQSLSDLSTSNTECCCKIGAPGCPWTEITLPANCRPVS